MCLGKIKVGRTVYCKKEKFMNTSIWRSILLFIGIIVFLVMLGLVFFPGH